MKITIIIPVYNEEENIDYLIDKILTEIKKINNHIIEILLVDGKSNDNTVSIIRNKIILNPSIHLIIEQKQSGLGSAYICGIRYAVECLKTDAFMEFDGDFQHDPEDIHKLINKLEYGYDYIIGSRYVTGGSVPVEWPWYRKFISIWGNRIIKFVLNIYTVDNTSGFKLTRVNPFIRELPINNGKPISYRHAYKIHFLYSMLKANAKTVEVPINFLNRNKGLSKSTFRDIFESLKVILIIKKRELF